MTWKDNLLLRFMCKWLSFASAERVDKKIPQEYCCSCFERFSLLQVRYLPYLSCFRILTCSSLHTRQTQTFIDLGDTDAIFPVFSFSSLSALPYFFLFRWLLRLRCWDLYLWKYDPVKHCRCWRYENKYSSRKMFSECSIRDKQSFV